MILGTASASAQATGNLPQAQHYLALAQRCHAGSNQPVSGAALDLQTARLAVAAGDWDTATGLIQGVLERVTAGDPRTEAAQTTQVGALVLRGRICEQQGEPAAAETWFLQALVAARQLAPSAVRQVALEYAGVLDARGAAAAAKVYYRLALLPDPAPELRPVA